MSGSRIIVPAILCVVNAGSPSLAAQEAGLEARYERFLEWDALIEPPVAALAYTPDGTRLFYTRFEADTVGAYSLVLSSGQVEPLFDVARLRSAVEGVAGGEALGNGVPFRRFRLATGSDRELVFALGRRAWVVDRGSYEVRPFHPPETGGSRAPRPQVLREGEFGRPDLLELASPDGSRVATLVQHDAAVRDVRTGTTRRLTSDGRRDRYWGYDGVAQTSWAWWSPDGRRLALRKVDMRGVDSIPLMRWLEEPPRVDWIRSVHNVRGGRPLPREELYVWHADSDRLQRLDTGDPTNVFLRVLGWRPDGTELVVLRLTRDYRDLEVLALDPVTGRGRILLREAFQTCFTTPLWRASLRRFWPLAGGDRFIWRSDREGWHHLFLYDFEGDPVVRLTSGSYQVDDLVGIDERGGWVYFIARSDPERPYDTHVHRVRLDGSGLQRLTTEPGRHAAELLDGSRYLEVWRRGAGEPSVLELRRVDGSAAREVARSDIGRLRAAGWIPPEEFTVKAADGETDLWGVLYKPADFDPSRRYPVVEIIYGGPVLEYAPRWIPHWTFPHALAQLGYIVVILDARGTPGRGRAFHEAGFDRASVVIADHAAALRGLAERHEYLDLERLGIIGSSWGADFTTRALLWAPDLYRVGVAVSGGWWGDPDRGLVKATVFEQCAVLKEDEPVAPSLATLAGHLLVIHGTADVNMSGSTDLMWWLDSVIEAGKHVDLLILPERPHSLLHENDTTVLRATAAYLDEHLATGKSPR